MKQRYYFTAALQPIDEIKSKLFTKSLTQNSLSYDK